MTDVLVVLILVLWPMDVIVALRLTQLSHRNPGIVSLHERAVSAAALTIAATIASFLAFARLGIVRLRNDEALALLAVALALVSVPALYWLVLLFTGRFWEDRE